MAWILTTEEGEIIESKSYIVYPHGFNFPEDAIDVHGITQEIAEEKGRNLNDVLIEFLSALKKSRLVVGHNVIFDQKIIGAELYRLKYNESEILEKPSICPMRESTDFCAIPTPRGYKYPSLSYLYRKLFGASFVNVHNAMADVTATMKCFFELARRGIITRPVNNE